MHEQSSLESPHASYYYSEGDEPLSLEHTISLPDEGSRSAPGPSLLFHNLYSQDVQLDMDPQLMDYSALPDDFLMAPAPIYCINEQEEAELMAYWVQQYSILEAGHFRFFRPTKDWWVRQIPQLCAANDDIRDLVLSIATSHKSMYEAVDDEQKHISAVVYQTAVERHRQQISELSLESGAWGPMQLEVILVQSYLVAIRAVLAMRKHKEVPTSEENVLLSAFATPTSYTATIL